MAIHLDFLWHISHTKRDFVVFQGNNIAYKIATCSHSRNVFVSGPHMSGKTHLSKIFKDRTKDACIYDLDQEYISEDILMHILDNTQQINFWMSSRNVSDLFQLNDLKTRFSAMLRAEILEPDESAFISILTKRLHDYGFFNVHEICKYVSLRMNITYESINQFTVLAHRLCVDRRLSYTSALEIIEKIDTETI